MKRIFVIILSIIVNVINAQTQILPLEMRSKRVEGVYYKDINDVLTPYIGTWEGKVNGNTFRITFEKIKEYHEFDKYWRDRLQGKYEMRDKNGKILYSTYNQERAKVFSLSSREMKGIFTFGFIDSCIVGDIYLKFTDASKTKIEWEYDDIPQTISESRAVNCAKINEMPQEKFILTKQ